MKDYYKIIGVPPAATAQEIKRAYRALAFKYHPDKNPDSPMAEAQFKEVQEAYAVLSDTGRRAKYDDERWLTGMGSKTHYKEAVTPGWLHKVSRELNASLATMDTHRMSQGALQAYILLILSDAHLGVLQQHGDKEMNAAIIAQIIIATEKLDIRYHADIVQRLAIIAAGDAGMVQAVDSYAAERSRQARQAQLLPYVVIAITLALCVLMYLYAGWK